MQEEASVRTRAARAAGDAASCLLRALSPSPWLLPPQWVSPPPARSLEQGVAGGRMEKCRGLSRGPAFLFPCPDHRQRASSGSRKEWPG